MKNTSSQFEIEPISQFFLDWGGQNNARMEPESWASPVISSVQRAIDLSLDDKNASGSIEVNLGKPLALLTGVGRSAGIAAGIARQLATDGWDLALNFWSEYDERMPWANVPAGLDELIGELHDRGAAVLRLPGNLEQAETPAALFRAIVGTGRSPSALVLAHCESVDSSILSTTVESFDRHYAVNVRASWQLIREFALHAPRQGVAL